MVLIYHPLILLFGYIVIFGATILALMVADAVGSKHESDEREKRVRYVIIAIAVVVALGWTYSGFTKDKPVNKSHLNRVTQNYDLKLN